jgi:hypothetical protein
MPAYCVSPIQYSSQQENRSPALYGVGTDYQEENGSVQLWNYRMRVLVDWFEEHEGM